MAQLPPAISIRLQSKDSFSVAISVIGELCDENKILKGENKYLLDKLAKAEARAAKAEADLAKAEAKLNRPGKTSKNSSIPPSQAIKPNGEAKCESDIAKLGPRRGHPGSHRPLCDNPTAVMDMCASTCPHCQADVSGVEQDAGEVYDHVEIPLAPAMITRVVLRRGTCPCCSKTFKASPPRGMEPGSPYGPNLRATVLHFRHSHAVSYERMAVLLETQFGVKLSEGALASMLKSAAPAFARETETIRQRLLAGTVIGSDETRFRVRKENWWLWVFQNPDSCVFTLSKSRGKDVVEQFLGDERPPAWVSDRLGSQTGWAKKHQACLAHLLRDAQYAIDNGDTVLAPSVIPLLCRAIRVWRNRDRLIAKFGTGTLVAFYWRFFQELLELLAEPIPGNPVSEKFRRSLTKWQKNLFVFLTRQDVPPTNNSSEQALRWSAIFRKVTNCFRSVWGGELHANIRSVLETARRRNIGALQAIYRST
jgi:transposase